MRLHELDIPQPKGKTATSVEEAVVIADRHWLSSISSSFLCTWWTSNGNCLSSRRITSLYEKCGKN